MESGKLQSIVKSICNGDYSPGELVEFIDVSQKIAISYLKFQESIGKNIKPKNIEGLNNLEDIAIDCIAGLFMRNEEGEFVQLKRYFGPALVQQNFEDNKYLLLMLRRLVVKKTKQELSRIFRERDPEGAKIIRNIRVAIRNSELLCVFREMGREFVYLKNSCACESDLRKNCTEIPEKTLSFYFSDAFNPNDSVSAMIKKMLALVEEDEEYKNYLPVETIASIVRNFTFNQFSDHNITNIDNSSPLHDLHYQEVNEINKNVIRDIQSKIKLQYIDKDKLDQQKASIYFNAISDFVQDLTYEKECESNFKYLKRYLPHLSQQIYRDEERSIFEYLIKVTRKSLRKKLKELL